MKEEIDLRVNKKDKTVIVDPSTPLLYVLRNNLELNGPKFGCGLGQCGACMVLLDGEAGPSCVLPVAAAKGREIITIEGLGGEKDQMHPVQKAMCEKQAAQCGYCLNGMIVSAVALLESNPNPNDREIRQGMQANLCRCGTYSRFLKAIHAAAETMGS